jgi:hypothetical protein
LLIASGPICASETVRPLELTEISAHDDETSVSRVTRHQQVVTADRQPIALQHGRNVGRMTDGVRIERKHIETDGKGLIRISRYFANTCMTWSPS